MSLAHHVVPLAVSLGLLATAPSLTAQTDLRPLAEQPHHGLLVRDDASGLLVGWILPGPLNGLGFTSDVVNRGDLILAVNGQKMDREALDQFMRSANPGDRVTLRVRHTAGNPETAVPAAGAGGDEADYEITLASREQWSGPIAHVQPDAPPFDPEKVVPETPQSGILDNYIRAQVREQDLAEPIDKLLDYFRTTVESSAGANMLSRVRYGFHRPGRLAELERTITSPLSAVPNDPALILQQAAANLDCPPPHPPPPVDCGDVLQTLDHAAGAIEQANLHLETAFGGIDASLRESLSLTMIDITDTVAQDLYIHGHPEAKRLIGGLRASLSIDYHALLAAASNLSGFMRPGNAAPADAARVPVPDALAGAVQGEILGAQQVGEEWIIYGGPAANSYDMTRIAAVIDSGGNDAYRWPQEARPDAQLIVDFAGDDSYTSPTRGPASALLGVSLIVDQVGNDLYEGAERSCGVGVMGVGLIVDRGGADTYRGTRWSIGTAFYGLGAIIDNGTESDTYIAELMSQGVGGPRGFGAIIDQNGRDLYRVNGPAPSAYGTPAVFVGFSQGVGVGVRLYDSGGIGVISDLGGDDRYEGGEFCQGGGYYWALGILNDRSGNDLYYGNRYGQAWAAHQALGILADDAGDDTYWTMTAASQSGSWDISATLLIDRAGNDSYQADGLAQGAAAQQAIAWLVDLDGVDRYVAPAGATRGQSGGNDYHFTETGCYSWSVLLDAGGTEDFYSAERFNGQTEATGSPNHETPQASPLHGLFIDTSERVMLEFKW